MSNLSDRIASLSPEKRALLEKRLLEATPREETRREIPRRGARDAPLSFAQQRLWFLDQLDPEKPHYNLPLAVRLKGPLDRAALSRALDVIVERHEALRTVYTHADGEPRQIVEPPRRMPLEGRDLSGVREPERADALARCLAEEVAKPFDLGRGPMLRATLIREAENRHVLILCMHHIAGDGWSLGIFLREFAELYAAAGSGRDAALPELPIQYTDYAVWQRDELRGDRLEESLGFWAKELSGELPVLTLPADRPRPSRQTFAGTVERRWFPADRMHALEELSRKEGATLFMTLLAAFEVLMRRLAGQETILVGTPIAGRNRVETENLIGFFVNTLVLRGDLDGDPTFRELLGRVRENALSAFAHQDLPFEKLVEELRPDRSLAHSPIFQAMFGLDNYRIDYSKVAGLELEPIEIDPPASYFDLTLAMTTWEKGLRASLFYSTDLFDRETIERWLGSLGVLLEAIVANPGERISRLPLLTEEERRRLLVEWNDTRADYPRDKCAHELFEEQAKKSPDAAALESEGEPAWTYRDLDRRADRIAERLRDVGVGPETLVGLCVPRSPNMVAGLLGVWKAGGAYVPLDPQYPPERLQFMLADTGSPVLLTVRSLAEAFPAFSGQVVLLDSDREAASEGPARPAPTATPENLAYVIYTSGSTGRPKGVMIPHRALVNYLTWCIGAYSVRSGRGAPVHSSLSFDLTVTGLLAPLLAGRAVRLLRETAPVDALGELLAREGDFSLVKITPAHLELLASQLPGGSAAGRSRAFVIGGEALRAESLAFWRERAPETALFNEYGPTETTVGCAVYRVRAEDPPAGPVSIGRPIANTRLHVLDGHGEPVPIGVAGELFIGGAGVGRGYWNRPEQTAERFVPDPFSNREEDRLYRSGDLARYRPDGNLEFVGRRDDQVKIRGFRIELAEVEAVLQECAGLREVSVVAREDVPGDKRLVAYVVPGREPASAESLRRAAKETLPDYMVPSAFVKMESLPRTANGKVDRGRLPEPGRSREPVEFVEPSTPHERAVAGIFAELLRVERVGANENFFDLGGHSLLATQLVSRLRDRFGLEIPLRQIFESPTVAELASAVSAPAPVRAAGAPPIRRRASGGALSFAQERLWFLDRMDPGQSIYNVPEVLRLSGTLEVRALESALRAIVERHEVLRTAFPERDGQPFVEVERASLVLSVTDISGLPASRRESEASRIAAEEARVPVDLGRPPLMRARLLRLSPEEHWLVLTMHHIASDGWSVGVLLSELSALYEAERRGVKAALPELPIQYADYAAWQRERLQGESLGPHLEYWRRELAGDAPRLELPTDRPRAASPSFAGATERRLLSSDLRERLEALGRRESASLFMVVLAAFEVLLARLTGQEEVLVGTPVAGRDRTETEGLIGCFVNTLVLRGDASGNPTFREFLGRVRETALGAYAHQDLPFEKLVQELRPDRDLAHSPLFQVMLSLGAGPVSPFEMEGLRVEPVDVDMGLSTFDLSWDVVMVGSGMQVSAEYARDLFEGETVRRWLTSYEVLLEGIVSDPGARIWDLPVMTAEERGQLEGWSGKRRAEADECVQALFEKQAVERPEAAAAEYEGERLTYGELDARANRLGHYLRGLGVGRGVRVGVCVGRSLDLPVALLGVLKAGGAYVPLDPGYPAGRLRFFLEDSGVSVVVTESRHEGVLGEGPWKTVRLDAEREAIGKESGKRPESGVEPTDLAYILYTSGSTGRPKGVMVEHRSLAQHARSIVERYELKASDRVLQFASLSFDVAGEEMYPTWAAGGAVVYRSGEAVGIGEFEKEMERLQPTVMNLPAGYWHEWVLELSRRGGRVPGWLRLLVSGSDRVQPERLEWWREHTGVKFLNGYGPTEATITATVYEPPEGELPATGCVPIGKPLEGVRVRVVDGHGGLAAMGVAGELWIGGGGVARGYWGLEEQTGEKFLADPFGEAGERVYRTGDRVRYLRDGNLEFLGRLDGQVKVRGFRIEPGEIEAALEQEAGVREAAVVAREEAGETRLVAYVVLSEGTAGRVKEHLKQRVPGYMVPSHFVEMGALPRTENGKVDRRRLPEPGQARGGVEEGYVAPQTPLEEAVAKIWGELLHREAVGAKDNFFDLGGHSLLATQVVSRLREAFGLELPLRTLFESPTVEELALAIAQGQAEQAAPEELQRLLEEIERESPRDSQPA